MFLRPQLQSYSDEVILDLISRKKGAVKFLSPKIQNDLLHVLRQIRERQSPYYALILPR